MTFLETSSELKSGLAQISRIFAAEMEPFVNNPNYYLITSDVDTIPVQQGHYLLPDNADIHITDAFCCRVYAHRGFPMRMFPMATIGMRVSTWRDVMQYESYSSKQNLVDRIWETTEKEFEVMPYNMSRGLDARWFLDQVKLLHLWESLC